MRPISILSIQSIIAAMLLTACAGAGHTNVTLSRTDSDDSAYGKVDSIEVSREVRTGMIGIDGVFGGLIGGLIANQFGGGSGRMWATAAAAGGGIVVGNQIQQNHPREIYRIRVQLDSGAYQTVSQDSDADLNVGNRVHIDNGRVYRY